MATPKEAWEKIIGWGKKEKEPAPDLGPPPGWQSPAGWSPEEVAGRISTGGRGLTPGGRATQAMTEMMERMAKQREDIERRKREEMAQRMEEQKALLEGRITEQAAAWSPFARFAETRRKEEEAYKARPFAGLQERFASEIEKAAARQPTTAVGLTPEEQALEAGFAGMGKQFAQAFLPPSAAEAAAALPTAPAKAMEAPTMYPGPEELESWRGAVETMPRTGPKDRALEALQRMDAPELTKQYEGFSNAISILAAQPGYDTLNDKLAELSAIEEETMDLINKNQLTEARYNELIARYDAVTFTPHEESLLKQLSKWVPRLMDLSKQLNPFITNYGLQRFDIPGLEKAVPDIGVKGIEDVNYLWALKALRGKTYSEIFASNENVDNFRGTEQTTTDALMRMIDPRYAAFSDIMRLKSQYQAPLPSERELGREAFGRVIGEPLKELGREVSAKASAIPGVSQLYNYVIKPIYNYVLKPGATFLLGVLADLEQLPEDMIGIIVSGLKGDPDEFKARLKQFVADFAAPGFLEPNLESEDWWKPWKWEAGLSKIHIPKGRWELPEEIWKEGFSFTENPYIDMIVQSIVAWPITAGVGGLTQAAEIRRHGLWDKLSNADPRLGDAIKTAFEKPTAANIRNAREIFESSGVISRINREVSDAIARGDISDWVRPTADVLAKTTDERQINRLLSRALSMYNVDPDSVRLLREDIARIAGLKPAQRADEWGKALDRLIAGKGFIPTKPGYAARFPVTHPKAYESFQAAKEMPANFSLRKLYAGAHPYPIGNLNLNTLDAPEAVYNYLINMGVGHKSADWWARRLLNAVPEERGLIARQMDEFLEGHYYFGLSRDHTFSSIASNLSRNVPMIDPSQIRRYIPELDRLSDIENDLYSDIITTLRKSVPDITDETLAAIKGKSRMIDKQFSSIVNYMKENKLIDAATFKSFKNRIAGVVKSKTDFIDKVKGAAGKLEEVRMTRPTFKQVIEGGKAQPYQAKTQVYGRYIVEGTDPDGKTFIKEVLATEPMTAEQLSRIYKFNHSAAKEIYRFQKDELFNFLRVKDFGRKMSAEVNGLLNNVVNHWKKYMIYTRPSFWIKTYATGQFKNLIMGTIDPSDVKAYRRLLEKGEVVLDTGDVIKVDPKTLNILRDQADMVHGDPFAYRRDFTGSWMFADSTDDPAQAVRNFINQFLNDEGVQVLIKDGDDAFLDWCRTSEKGKAMMKNWKPYMDVANKTDRAEDYRQALRTLLIQTESTAPETYKAMLYYAGLGDVDDLPAYFRKIADKSETGAITQGEISHFLRRQGVKEQFGVPMVKRPAWFSGAAPQGKAMKWLEDDAGSVYSGIVFRGARHTKDAMYQSATIDYAKQLIAQGLDADTAIRAGAAHGAKLANDILLDWTRKMSLERKYGWMSPFFTALRLDSEAWAKMMSTRPGLAGTVGKYFSTTARENEELPGYLRFTIPITIGERTYYLSAPQIALMPWAYSLPQGGESSAWWDFTRGALGPFPRAGIAQYESWRASSDIKKWTEEAAALEQKRKDNEGYLAETDQRRLNELYGNIERAEYKTGGAAEELSGALMGIPKAWSRGKLKGDIQKAIDRIPETQRTPGWTEAVFEQQSKDNQRLLSNYMNQYRANTGSYDTDAAFLYAVDQLPGVEAGALTPLTAAAGRFLKPPATVYPKMYGEVAEKKAEARAEEIPFYSGTPIKPETGGERYTPYEWQQRQAETAYGGLVQGVTAPAREAFGVASTQFPERLLTPGMQALKEGGQSFFGLTAGQRGWAIRERDRQDREAKLTMLSLKGAPDTRQNRDMRDALRKAGYDDNGDPSEALLLYRRFQDSQGMGKFMSWVDFLEDIKEIEYPMDIAAQDRLDTYKSFYPFPPAKAPATNFFYGGQMSDIRQEYYNNITLISQLRETLGYEKNAARKQAIQDQIDALTERNKQIMESPIGVPNLEYMFNPAATLGLAQALAPIPIPQGILPSALPLTTEQLAKAAYTERKTPEGETVREPYPIPPPELTTTGPGGEKITIPSERKMPTPDQEKMLKMTGTTQDKYLQGLVAMTTQTTWGKSTIPMDMSTAMAVTGMTADEIRRNNGKGGLGKPRYDPLTKQVYLSSMPIDWLDKATQDFLRGNVDDDTWAKIMANASTAKKTGGGGGGGWRYYGRGGYGYGRGGGRGFVRTTSKGPVDEMGKSKVDVFFSLPTAERTAYLDANPDLKEYFRRRKEGESDEEYTERMRLMDLADRYYRLPRESRREFLMIHPELVAYFEQLRRKKDEYFRRAMARAFVDNPELWEKYMEAQLKLTDELIANMAYRGTFSQVKETRRKTK